MSDRVAMGLELAEIPLSDLRDFRVGNGSEASLFLGDGAVLATRISDGKTLVVLQANVNFRFPGLAARIVAALSDEAVPAAEPAVWETPR